jgi:hypothetical protein
MDLNALYLLLASDEFDKLMFDFGLELDEDVCSLY